jgi:hypothetical protein
MANNQQMRTIQSVRIGPISEGESIISTYEVPIDFEDDLDNMYPLPSAPPDPYLTLPSVTLPEAILPQIISASGEIFPPVTLQQIILPIAIESDSEDENQISTRVGTPIVQSLYETMSNEMANAIPIASPSLDNDGSVFTQSESVRTYFQIRIVENFQMQELSRRSLLYAEEMASRRIYLRDIIQHHIDTEQRRKQRCIDEMNQIFEAKRVKFEEYQRAQCSFLKQRKRESDELIRRNARLNYQRAQLELTIQIRKEEREKEQQYDAWRRHNPRIIKYNSAEYPESYRDRQEIVKKREKEAENREFYRNVVDLQQSEQLQKDIENGYILVMVKNGHYRNPEMAGYATTFRRAPIDNDGNAINEEDSEIIEKTRNETKQIRLNSYLFGV